MNNYATHTRFQPMILLLLCLMLMLCYETGLSQGFLRTNGKQIVNEQAENILLRGVGLGGWMLQEGYMLRVNGEGQQYRIKERIEELVGAERTARFYDAWLSNHTRRIDIDSMRAWGFNSVRLPMHYNLFTPPIEDEKDGSITWLERGFEMTDSLLSWCKANRMYLILDLHAAPGGQGTDSNISDRDPSKPSLWDSEANQKKTIALWSKLADRYKDEPWIGGYDIMNEPNWGFSDYENDKNGLNEKGNEPLKKLLVAITKAIREVDQKHIIIIEGNGWGNNYNGMLPPWDDNMVISYHKYWNYNDDKSLQAMLETREKYNVPIWLGETGENSNVWFTQAIELLERHNIGWAWWPLKKLGFNNPLEIRSNPEYEMVLAYWAGKGPRPTQAQTDEGLRKLENALRLEQNIFHYDVIDAMMRQPHSKGTRPFKKHVITDGAVIQAVDYDLGRNGKAYYDTDTANYWVSGGPRGGNRGRAYRNDGVDIRQDSLRSDRYYITHIEDGEWWQYTVNVPAKGNYEVILDVKQGKNAGTLVVSVNGREVKTRAEIPAGTNETYTTGIPTLPLLSGKNTIRVEAETGGFDLKTITFRKKK
jgi:endoglucanase